MTRKIQQDTRSVMLAPNKMIPFDDERIPYPHVYGSYKLDGNRCFVRHDGAVLTRKMLSQPNRNLPGYLAMLCDIAKKNRFCFDMELMLPKAGHHGAITKILNAHNKPIPDVMTVNIFDCLTLDEWETGKKDVETIATFGQRFERMCWALRKLVQSDPKYRVHEQAVIKNAEDAEQMFADAIEQGHEGIMLRAADSRYKNWGRCGYKGAWLLKFKAEETFDARVIEVVQQRKMREGIERTKNKRGLMETPTRNDKNYTVTDSVGSFLVEDEKGRKSRIMFAADVADAAQRRKWWKQRKSLIGKMLEFKSYPGGLDGIRSGRMIRWRPDKD